MQGNLGGSFGAAFSWAVSILSLHMTDLSTVQSVELISKGVLSFAVVSIARQDVFP